MNADPVPILASACSALLGVQVLPQTGGELLSFADAHKGLTMCSPSQNESSGGVIYGHTGTSGLVCEVSDFSRKLVGELKAEIREHLKTDKTIEIFFDGGLLYNINTLAACGLSDQSHFFVSEGNESSWHSLDASQLELKGHFDFTAEKDKGISYERGGLVYNRPFGWIRYGLKVAGRFEDDVWLGEAGARTHSTPGEWAVSYHGTGNREAMSIAAGGYQTDRTKRALFGVGVYSTPDPNVAAGYAVEFQFQGVAYQVILQNRVNPDQTELIPGAVNGVGDYYLTHSQEDIRPYGICIRRKPAPVKDSPKCVMM